MTTIEEFETRRMAVADRILEHPDEFNMLAWGRRNLCGTTACIAGTAVLVAERQGICKVIWTPDLAPVGGETMGFVEVLDPGYACPIGPVSTVRTFAQEYLGLPEETNLFVRFDLTNEQAAKELLEEPYVEGEL